ncbi:MAG: transposase, partial [Verrucomicrobiota bacterium]
MIPTESPAFPQYQRFLPCDTTPWGVMHIVDRVVGRQFLLGPEEKDHFRSLLHSLLEFTGLEAVTWTCLDNHYHLLLRVPNALEGKQLREALSEKDILARMAKAYSSTYIDGVRKRLAYYRAKGNSALADTIVERLRSQLFDVAAFMHMLKRRFSAWFNKRHGRKGTLWEGRYRSTLIEDGEESLLQVAAYIDLNAVRAGIVEDPKD